MLTSSTFLYVMVFSHSAEYLRYCERYPVWHMKVVRSHMMKMLYCYLSQSAELRDMIGTTTTLAAYAKVCAFCIDLIEKNGESPYACSWYMRHRKVVVQDKSSSTGNMILVDKVPMAKMLQEAMTTPVATSFLNGDDTVWNVQGSSTSEKDCSIFDSLFT